MSEKKPSLHVNCALLDATEASEEVLSAYGSFHFNCAVVLQSAESHARMSRYPISMNCANVLIVPKGCRANVVNGQKTFGAVDKAEGPTVLIVNGNLSVLPDAGEALSSYTAIIVNGMLLCPDSLQAAVAEMTINGNTRFYPHDAILTDRSLEVSPFFILQAKPDALYYVTGEICMAEEGLQLSLLREKRVRLQAKTAVVRAGYLADTAELLASEDVKLLIVPDGCAYVRESAPLHALVLRYGKSLYLHGDLTLAGEDREALSSLDYLQVEGKVTLPKSLEDLFYQKCKKFKELEVLAEEEGKRIEDLPKAVVTRQLLESCPQGLSIRDCGSVRFDPDILPELLERVRLIEDSGNICCTRAQQAVLQLICRDSGGFSGSEEELPGEKEEEEKEQAVRVNCATYTL